MVDASQYAAHPNYQTAYYFATPSGRWQCAIIPASGRAARPQVPRWRLRVRRLGIGCMSEQSGKGFTFSADGFQPQYTEVPVDAP